MISLPRTLVADLKALEKSRRDEDAQMAELATLHEEVQAEIDSRGSSAAGAVISAATGRRLKRKYEEVLSVVKEEATVAEKCLESLDTLLEANAKLVGDQFKRANSDGQVTEAFGPGAQIAAQVNRGGSTDFWILARVVRYHPDRDRYEIEDEDAGETNDQTMRKRYILQRKHLIALPREVPEEITKEVEIKKATRVLAMFPSTTTFYPAIVEQSCLKRKEKDYLLKFEDDEEKGLTPVRRVDFRYVVRHPGRVNMG